MVQLIALKDHSLSFIPDVIRRCFKATHIKYLKLKLKSDHFICLIFILSFVVRDEKEIRFPGATRDMDYFGIYLYGQRSMRISHSRKNYVFHC